MTRMLRVVLLGLLSVSAIACKSSSGTVTSQAGAAAGKVLELSGSVTVRHGDVARPLAKGDVVEADDTIETGADGHVLIELAHNNATWELNANKKSKVRESLAWSEPKRDRSAKAVEQDTAAAGRPAERSAAETTATAKADEAPMAPPTAQAPAPGAATPVAAAPPASAAAPASTTRRGAASDSDGLAAPKLERERRAVAPPAPPPPPETGTRAIAPRAAAGPAPAGDAKGGGENDSRAGGGGAPQPGLGVIGSGSIGRGGLRTGAGLAPDARALLRAKQKDIAACWAGQKLGLVQIKIVIKADGTASTKLSSKGTITPQIDACVKKIVGTIQFPHAEAVVSWAVES